MLCLAWNQGCSPTATKHDTEQFRFRISSDIPCGAAAREISTLYYRATSRPGLRAFHGFLLGFSGRASSHLLQEFVYRWVTT